jgi:hypothetical protein
MREAERIGKHTIAPARSHMFIKSRFFSRWLLRTRNAVLSIVHPGALVVPNDSVIVAS